MPDKLIPTPDQRLERYHVGFMMAQGYLSGRGSMGAEYTDADNLFPDFYGSHYASTFDPTPIHIAYLSYHIQQTTDRRNKAEASNNYHKCKADT